MIKIDNKELRNLEEQVGFLTDKYNANQAIAEWGIRVVGIIDTPDLLPSPIDYRGEFGDAYAVGTEAPYTFYIWTRSSDPELNGLWFDVGDIAIPGPAGERGATGERGEKGERGSQWFSGAGQPTTTSGYQVGDMYINVNTGNVWHLHTEGWRLEGNIKGPQGPQGLPGIRGPQGAEGAKGPAGPAGPAGPIVDVIGELTNIDQLPDPSTLPRQAAYLISDGTAKHVWIITGNENNLSWYDAGVFNFGTVVTQNGSPVSEFDADTKLGLPTNGLPVGQPQFIMIKQNGEIIRQYLTGTNPANIAVYSYASQMNDLLPADATLYVATPKARGHAANKQYVDDAIAAIGTGGGGGSSKVEHIIQIGGSSVDSGHININMRLFTTSNESLTGLDATKLLNALQSGVEYPCNGTIREPSGYVNVITAIGKNSSGALTITGIGFNMYETGPNQWSWNSSSFYSATTESWFNSLEVTDTVI